MTTHGRFVELRRRHKSIFPACHVLSAMAVLSVLSACGYQPSAYALDPKNAGPYPENYPVIVANYIHTSFFDPYSVRDLAFTKPFTGRMWDQPGWLVCIQANAKNRMGAYTGLRWTAILIFEGAVINADENPAACGSP